MLKKGRSILLAALLGTIGIPAYAGTATGPVYFHFANGGWQLAPNGTTVKFCKSNVQGGINGTGQCYSTYTSNGHFSIQLQDLQGYFFFAWYDPNDWGSSTTRAWTNTSSGSGDLLSFGTYVAMNILTEMRPHRPNAIYPPNGATNVPLAFTLKWTNGLDAERTPGWTVTYDVYAYGEGGTELKVLADIPCNPDAYGYCSYYINNVVSNWRYFWRVVPKIHVPGPGAGAVRIYEQSSQQFTFVTQP